jgi:hypothetical protein
MEENDRVIMSVNLTDEEVKEALDRYQAAFDVEPLTDGDESDDDEVGVLRSTYCVTCGSSKRSHNIKASNPISIFFKALRKCGPNFTISKGRCR